MTKSKGIKGKRSLEQRFWSMVTIDELSGCWNVYQSSARAAFYIKRGVKKELRQVAWLVIHGNLPNKKLWNKCNNVRCVNPSHQQEQLSLEDRFWEKVDKRSNDECWEWKASRISKGYGIFNCEIENRAHRFSWVLHFGAIPEGMQVLHHCDNPSCCNPTHLFLGTNQDNVNDKISKGRMPDFVGVKNSCAKLNDADVRKIRETYVPRRTSQYKLAEMFGVSRGTIKHVLDRTTWSHVE